MAEPARFVFDCTDPDCYLAGERVLRALPELAEWVPVNGRVLGLRPVADRMRIAARVAELGLLELRWPAGWPPDPAPAALAATFAKAGGRTVAFAQALMRQGFAAGRDLGGLETVLIAAAAAEMHPKAVTRGMELRATRTALTGAHELARAAAVRALPAIVWRGQTFAGPDALGAAASAMSGARA